MNAAQSILSEFQTMKDRRAHAGTRAAWINDNGFTEEFEFDDGSRLICEHTANPGHEWRVEVAEVKRAIVGSPLCCAKCGAGFDFGCGCSDD